jgi:hypothetical protein
MEILGAARESWLFGLGLQAGAKVVEFVADRATKADALCSL